MKKHVFTGLVLLLTGTMQAQETVGEVLRSVEANNKALQSARCYYDVQLLESKSENNLSDPSVSYSYQYGNRAAMGEQSELVISQSFDFPTVYRQRSKLTAVRRQLFSSQYEAERREVLLNTKVLCFDLIWLNRRRQLLRERRRHAEQLAQMYDTRLRQGDANILETNKIKLELLNIMTEERLNENTRTGKLQELALLNGGNMILFADTVYPSADVLLPWETLREEALASDAALQILRDQEAEASRQVSVSRARGLPGLEVGYRENRATGGDRYGGFVVGMNIPLFSNRHQVKKAKSHRLYVRLKRENAAIEAENRLMRLYDRLQALQTSMETNRAVLESQDNETLLDKALKAGQISMIEYFVSIATLYRSTDDYLQLQNEYYKLMAEIYRYRL